MSLSHILTLFEYHYWAYDLIFRHVDDLTEDQFAAENRFPMGGVRGTLAHLLMAESLWRARLSGKSWDREQYLDFMKSRKEAAWPDLRRDFAKEQQAMQAHLDTLKGSDLEKDLDYADTRGNPFQQELIGILTHIVFHGMQHRSELAQLLTEAGHPPGDIDYLFWLREE
jgi:uncharacterized damage-inducible protein DinB